MVVGLLLTTTEFITSIRWTKNLDPNFNTKIMAVHKSLWASVKKTKFDNFVLAILGMIILGRFLPQVGVYRGAIDLDKISDIGVSLIFFFYGLKLSPDKLRSDLGNLRLHAVVQVATFVVFPLVVLVAMHLFSTPSTSLLWVGAFFMAALPSTVSSSVVMVSIAKGNIPAAIFNASISSLVGVFVTPLWMGLILTSGAMQMADMSGVVVKLICQVLVPVAVGMMLNRRWGKWAASHSKGLKLFDQSVILSIVYMSFSESFSKNLFSELSWVNLVVLFVGVVALFYLVYGLISIASKSLGFSREDRITALFCGSKKSLVHGTVMSSILFSGMGSLGIILLPIMVYHALQLVIVSFIAQRMSDEVD